MIKHIGWPAVEELLQEKNDGGQTPLHVACLWRNVQAVSSMLTKDCDKIIAKVCPYKNRKQIASVLKKASRRTLSWTVQKFVALKYTYRSHFIVSKKY